MAGDETFDSTCLARLRGRVIALAPFLIRLMPCPIALGREDVETTDWSDERDDLAEDFAVEE